MSLVAIRVKYEGEWMSLGGNSSSLPHNVKVPYRIPGNIGRELYLADWRISCHTTNIKSANIAPTA